MHRLPFILLVCLGALLAIIGGAVVLRAAPGFTLSLNQLIVDMITKVCAPYVSLKRLSSWF